MCIRDRDWPSSSSSHRKAEALGSSVGIDDSGASALSSATTSWRDTSIPACKSQGLADGWPANPPRTCQVRTVIYFFFFAPFFFVAFFFAAFFLAAIPNHLLGVVVNSRVLPSKS